MARGTARRRLAAILVVLAAAALLLTALISISALAFKEGFVPDGRPGATLTFRLSLWGSLTVGSRGRVAADLPLCRRP